MKNKKYTELSEPHLSDAEKRFDYLPDETDISNISPSLDKHALKKTLLVSQKRLQEVKSILNK